MNAIFIIIQTLFSTDNILQNARYTYERCENILFVKMGNIRKQLKCKQLICEILHILQFLKLKEKEKYSK